ncbi:MAG: hypothetical protein WBD46_20170 [Acidobacteriaceae bacterium]
MQNLGEKAMELHQLMRCPVDWNADTLTEISWSSILHLDWLHCLAERMTEGGDIPVTPEDYDELFEDVADSYELDHLLKNLELRRQDAEELYKARAGRLAGWTFITPQSHGKHFRATLQKKEVANATARAAAGGKRRPSLFWANYSSEQLKGTFWTWFSDYFDSELAYESSNFFLDPMIVYGQLIRPGEELYGTTVGKLWHKFTHLTNLRISMNALGDVGACDGRLTSFLCYDVHIDAKIVHCYPVSEAEAQDIMEGGEVLRNDSLNC